MGRQIGFFLLYIGLVVSMIAVAAYFEKTPSFTLCVIGVLLVVLSITMIIRFRPDPETADRFRSVKKITSRRRGPDG